MDSKFKLGLSYDDVLLVPQRFRGKSRSDIQTASNFSKNISLNLPIVSSNMDMVTELDMAILMAREGGIGVIHRFLPIKKQVKLIKLVKRAQNFIIEKPYTANFNATLGEVKSLMVQHGVSGILICNNEDKLKGIITNRDLRFTEGRVQDSVQLFMTPRESLILGNSSTTLQNAKSILAENKIEKLPIVDASGKITGIITSVDIQRHER